MLMENVIHVLMVALTVLSLNERAHLIVMERDVRTDISSTCTNTLLKSLPASSFSASSVLKNESLFGPYSAMMDAIYELKDSHIAWCPYKEVSNSPTEWLQVDFPSLKIIKTIFTKGRYDGNYGEYVSGYFFDYQRQDGLTWYRYQDDSHREIIKGNHDARNPSQQKFNSPLVAKRIRIIPINSKSSTVCLKFILYGCDFNDGVVSYMIPRGDKLSQGSEHVVLDDDAYDGTKFSNHTWLIGGMGKLMDNIVPAKDSSDIDSKRLFVVWDQTVQNKDHVPLLFQFDSERIFHYVTLYSMNIPTSMILPFSSLKIEIIDLKTITGTITILNRENYNQFLKVDLQKKRGTSIRMLVFFHSRWMGLSEVVFESEPVVGTTILPINHKTPEDITHASATERRNLEFSSKMIIPVTLISCFIGALIVVIIVIIICFFWVRQRKRRRYKSKLCDYRSMLMNDPTYPSNIRNINTISGKNSHLYGPMDAHVFGPNSSSTIGFRYVHPSGSSIQDYHPHSTHNSNEYEPIDTYWPKPPQQADSILKDPMIDQLDRQILLVPGAPDVTNMGGCAPVYSSSSTYSCHPYDANMSAPDIIPSTCITPKTYDDIFNIHFANSLKGLLGSSISCCHLTPVSQAWIETALCRLCEMNPTKVLPQKHVSEGDVGYITSGVVDNWEHGVIVAELKRNQITIDSKYAFYRQCFATIKPDFSSHPNLLPVIGKLTLDNAHLSIIYEYPSQINVVSFFHKLRSIPKSNDVSFSCSYVSQGSLLYLMKQLSDALAFLDENGVVHRDVSARNCSIGDKFHLFLSDFAIGLEEFQEDYISFSPPQSYTLTNKKSLILNVQLPLLWMPWEAITLGNYSSKSDVWSFGVTLWEIFTECQLKPYSTSLPMSHRDPGTILENSLLIASSHSSSILPNGRTFDQTSSVYEKGSCHTSDMSRHVRDIMHLCWHPNPTLRPTFQTLYSIISELSPDSKFVDEYGTLRRMIS